MRKLFTLAAAVLASFSLWAQEPAVSLTAASTTIDEWNATYDNVTISVVGASFASKKPCGVTANENAMSVSSADSHWIEISCPDGLSRIVISGSGNSTGATDWAAPLCVSESAPFDSTITSIIEVHYTGYDKACVENDIALPTGTKSVRLYRRMKVNTDGTKVGSGSNWTPASATGNQTYNITHVEAYAGGGVAPSTDPVATVTLEGPAEGFVGKEVSFSVTTDVKANAYKWYVDGAEQEGATAAKFNFTPEAERTYRILAAAKNDYNSDFVQSNGLDFVATVKPAAVPCAKLYPAATGDTPAQGAKAALTDASFGGNIIFAGAKSGDYAASFLYNDYGLQMCKGGADSVRVELGFNLAVGSKIELHINQNGLSSDKARGFKLLAPGQKAVLTATWQQADETDLEKVFEYEVTASDKLAGQNTFGIVRSESAILHAVIVSDCGEEIVPATDPVTSVTLAGPAEGFVGQTYSFKATADADVEDWVWFVNGVAVDGAKAATFAFTPDAVGTYAIKAGARNQYNTEDGWINSNEIALVVSAALEQVSVSANTEWDWTKAASVNEIKFTDATSPLKNERCLLANVAGMNNNAEFNSQAMLFEGEYPIRDSKYCQGQLLQFHTTVAGFVTVEYSNTSNREAVEGETEGQESLRRFLVVNGALVEGDAGSMKSNENTMVYNIPVAAGDVALSGRLPYRTDGKDVNQAEYLRYYKIQFTTDLLPRAIENIDASVKAVKVIQNGQLYIKRGDVLYNALGSIVK